MTRCSGCVLLGLLVLSVSAGARAQETACMEPPEFVGCPTGAPAFNLSGEPDKAGVVRYLNVGDELIVTGGEGAMESVSIWGVDSCGLWLQFAVADPQVAENPLPLKKPTYRPFAAVRKNVFKIDALGLSFQLRQVHPGRFKVTLLKDMQPAPVEQLVEAE